MGLYPVLILWGGIVALDTTSGPQLMISEPIVSCSLLGVIFGAPETGLMLGILFQLLWLGYLPLGGTLFTDNSMAAYISTASVFAASQFFRLYRYCNESRYDSRYVFKRVNRIHRASR